MLSDKFTGTERCNEALQKLEKKYDIVVNIQGDEPLIEPEIIDGVVKALQVNLYSLNNFWLIYCYCHLMELRIHVSLHWVQIICYISKFVLHMLQLR